MNSRTEQYLEMAQIRLDILRTAVDVLKNGQNNVMKPDVVMKLADAMEDFVFGFGDELDALDDMLDLQIMDEPDTHDFEGNSGEVN